MNRKLMGLFSLLLIAAALSTGCIERDRTVYRDGPGWHGGWHH